MSASAAAVHTPAPTRRSQPRRPSSRPPLRVVGPPRRVRRWLTLVVVTLLLGVGGIASVSAAAAEAAFTVRELEADVEQLERRAGALSGEVAELESLSRIRHIATEELGMVPAEQARYVEAGPRDAVPVNQDAAPPADPLQPGEASW